MSQKYFPIHLIPNQYQSALKHHTLVESVLILHRQRYETRKNKEDAELNRAHHTCTYNEIKIVRKESGVPDRRKHMNKNVYEWTHINSNQP